MALKWTVISGNFNDTLYNDLLKLEAPKISDRLNGKMVGGNFTIGIGFDLVKGGLRVQQAVFDRLGLDESFLRWTAAIPDPGTPARKEFDFVRELSAAIAAHKGSASLNAIMAKRAEAYQTDPAYAAYLGSAPRNTFSFSSDAEVRQTFDDLWAPAYQKDIFGRWPELASDTGFASSKELIALASMTWNGGVGLLGGKLRAAVRAGNRAEAWFEIRYGTNGGDSKGPGIAKRRYVESQLFGLYDNPSSVSIDEAKKTFAMLLKHRSEILSYEGQYGIPPDGANATRDTISLANNDPDISAVVRVQSLFDVLIPARNAFVSWVNTQLPAGRQIDINSINPAGIYFSGGGDPGESRFVDASDSDGKGAGLERNLLMGGDKSDTLLAGKGDDVLIGMGGVDILEGGEGTDQLYGGQGNDVLSGGIGDDILYGGDGDDLYIWNTGDGSDTIIDDNGGHILINGGTYTFAGGYMIKDSSSNTWRDSSGQIKITHNSPWRIELPDGSVIQLGEDFDPSEWGIVLGESLENGRTYTGDQRALLRGVEVDFDILPGDSRYNTYKWSATSWNADGSLNSGVAEANFNDVIYASSGNDKISGLGGNDALDGGEGDDVIDGGVGEDLISGGKGRDTIRGGDGNDYIEGSGTLMVPQRFRPDDTWQAPPGRQVFTSGSTWGIYQGDDPDVIVWAGAGDPPVDETGAGDIIDGGAGDDHIIGSWASDSIEGGVGDDWMDGIAGDDVISGGEGNDFIRGDGLEKPGLLDTVPGAYHGRDILDGGADDDQIQGGGNNDQLFGGTGDDYLWGDDSLGGEFALGAEYHGDDYLNGGDGNDYLEGGGKADVLYGAQGDDTIWGDVDAAMVQAEDGALIWGDDVLDGEDGNDTLLGGGRDDVLSGGDGNDVLFGDQSGAALQAEYHGQDVLDGGDGDDYLEGGGNDDTLIGGAGRDTLWGDTGSSGLAAEAQGNDSLDGGDDDDVLIGGGGGDTLLGGSGADVIYGDNASNALSGEFQGDDYIDAGEGFDQVVGGGGADTIYGGDDGDYIVGDQDDGSLAAEFHGDDYLDGGAGNDTIEGDGGNDTLIGGDGNDWLSGDNASSLLDPGTLIGNDYIEAGAGDDIALGGLGDDTIDGGEGADYLYAGAGNDIVIGGTGSDVMYGGAGDDIFELSSSLDGDVPAEDYVIDYEGNNVVRFDALVSVDDLTFTRVNDFDLRISGPGIETVVIEGAYLGSIGTFEFGDGTVLDFTSLIGRHVMSPLNDVHIISSDRAVTGGAGADSIVVDGSGNTVSGGRGNDTIDGRAETGAGTTYRFALGDGADIIRQSIHEVDPALNQIVFGEGIALGDLHLSIESGALLIRVGANGDRILLANSLASNLVGMPSVGMFRFADGTTIAYADLLARGIEMTDGGAALIGTSFADLIDGSNASTRIESLGGDDVIHAGGGDDTIIAGDGNDVLDGGTGSDELDGGAGADVYIFDRGYGTDHIANSDATSASADVIRMGAGIAYGDIQFYRFGNDLILAVRDTADRLTIGDYFGANAIGQIALMDGTSLSHADVLGLAVPEPFTAGDDVRTLSDFDDVADGLAGNDKLFGRAGNDVLMGGDGFDELRGGDGNDMLTGGEGLDMVYGDAGDDTLIADAGSDSLSGGAGSDTYVIRSASGSTTISNDDNSAGRLDTIRFADDITEADLVIRRVGDNLVITAGSTSVTVTDHFANGGNNTTHIDWITFENDATVLSIADILARTNRLTENDDNFQAGNDDDVVDGRGGNDTLRGGAGNDVLLGGDGNDKLYGESGDDILDAGTGSSGTLLSGGTGNDTYRLSKGFGGVSIVNDDTSLTKTDVIEFGSGIAEQDIRISRSGDDLVLNRSGSQDTVYVTGFFVQDGNTGQRVEQVRFADGTVWTYQDVMRRSLIGGAGLDTIIGFGGADDISGGGGSDWLYGRAGNDHIDGGDGNDLVYGELGSDVLFGGAGDDTLEGDADGAAAGNDELYGGDGQDTLWGRAGNDILVGGKGRDLIRGGKGADIIRFGLGDGVDRVAATDVTSSSDADVLAFDASITPAMVRMFRVGYDGSGRTDLIILVNNGETQVIVEDYFSTGQIPSVSRIEFADGTAWDGAYIANHLTATYDTGHGAQTGTSADDTFLVDDSFDTVQEAANGGYDIVQSRALFYSLPDNVEEGVIVGPYGASLTGSTTSKVLRGNTGNDVLQGVARGFNTYYGGAGDDNYFVVGSGGESQNFESIVEYMNEGVDTVTTDQHYHYRLADNVENLTDIGFSNSYYTYGGQIVARSFTGNALDNVITANRASAAGYVIDGGAGADTMIGSDASDTYVVDNIGDIVVDFSDARTGSVDTVRSSITYALPDLIENLSLIGSDAIDGYGSNGNNVMSGADNAAINHLHGGKGDDTYRIGLGDVIVEYDGEGSDTVSIAYWMFGATFSLSDYGSTIENIMLDVAAGAVNASGDDKDNVVTGNSYGNILIGGGGNDTINDGGGTSSASDTLDGGAGDDYLIGGDGWTTYVFSRGGGHDVVDERGASSYDSIRVDASIDKGDLLYSRNGDDLVLRVKDSTETMTVQRFFGAKWDGTLVDTINAIRFADGSQWDVNDIVALATRPPNDVTEGADLLVGGSGIDIFDAGGGNDKIWGGGGNDLLFGGAGDDLIRGEDGADTLHGGDGNDQLYGGGASSGVGDVIFGDAGDDWLYGGDAEDTLIGGSGNDRLDGGAGIDTFRFGRGWGFDQIDDYVRSGESGGSIIEFDESLAAADIVIVQEGFGTYTIRSVDGEGSIWATSDNVGEIRFADGTRWDWSDLLLAMITVTGTSGDDVLGQPEGYDEFMYDGAIFKGLEGNDRLEGGRFGDTLDGGTGNDTMIGHGGDDTYLVDSASDVVTEASNEGYDIVISTVTHTLATNVEELDLAGTLAIDGTGNSRDNQLYGNVANNVLNGAGGADYMSGGLGDDTYVVDNVGDYIYELADEGIDLVRSSISYSLEDTELENLTLTGSSGLTGTGNAKDNVLTGNSGANTLYGYEGNDRLDGGTGADSLRGGIGDDTYFVDNTGDSVVELAGEGIDFVNSTVTHTLASNVENLRLTGTGAINGTGNTLDNVIYAGSGNNTLDGLGGVDTVSYLYAASAVTVSLASTSAQATGGSGSDTLRNVENLTGSNFNDTLTGSTGANVLDGGTGADKLSGGAGNDTYVLGRGYGADQITENDATAGNQDTALFGSGIDADQLWFSQSGNNLDVSIIGTSDKFTLNNWYLGNQYHVEQFRLANGQVLQDTQVASLVQAMAAFAPLAAGQTTLPANYASALQPVIAANWH